MTTKNKIIIVVLLVAGAYYFYPPFTGIVNKLIDTVSSVISENVTEVTSGADKTEKEKKESVPDYGKSTMTFNPRRGRTD